MAAQEQEGQRVVLIRQRLVVGSRRKQRVVRDRCRGRRLPPAARLLAAPPVGEPPRSDRDQPGPRILRDALIRPLHSGGQERLLHCVLAQVEVPVAADQRAEDPRRQLAKEVLDVHVGIRAHISVPDVFMTGRTSIAKYRASGQRAAISTARSRLSHSTIR